MGNRTVGSVNSVGLVEALNLGVSNLTGVVQASDPREGQVIVYSKVWWMLFLMSVLFHTKKQFETRPRGFFYYFFYWLIVSLGPRFELFSYWSCAQDIGKWVKYCIDNSLSLLLPGCHYGTCSWVGWDTHIIRIYQPCHWHQGMYQRISGNTQDMLLGIYWKLLNCDFRSVCLRLVMRTSRHSRWLMLYLDWTSSGSQATLMSVSSCLPITRWMMKAKSTEYLKNIQW